MSKKPVIPKKKSTEGNQEYFKKCIDSLTKQGVKIRDAASQCSAQFEENLLGAVTRLQAPVNIQNLENDNDNDRERGFLISAKTGDPVETYFGRKLVINVKGIRFEPVMPILRSHDRDRIIGSGQGFIDGNNLFVEGTFSKSTKDAEEVLALADEGFPWQASIGVWAEEIKFLEAKEKKTVNGLIIDGPAEIWMKSYVRETSFTPIGADERTAAISLDDNDLYNPTISKQGENKKMDIETLKEEDRSVYDEILKLGKEEGLHLGIGQERSRVIEILEAKGNGEATVKAIKDGLDVGDAYKEFFLAEKQKRVKALDELENGATEPQGQIETVDGTGDETIIDFMEKVREIKLAEKISTVDAMKKAVRQYPDEHKAFIESKQG